MLPTCNDTKKNDMAKDKHIGIISDWYVDKKYGFINDRSGSRIFFHITGVTGKWTPVVGREVSLCALMACSELGDRRDLSVHGLDDRRHAVDARTLWH